MKTNTLFQVRFRPSVKPPRGFTKSAHYNVTDVDGNEYLIGNTWLPAKDFIKIEVEDAPVFQKPILRKIASLKPDEVIECNTHAELKAVLEQAEREGLVWQAIDRKPTDKPPCIAPVCIGISDNENNCIAQISLESAKIEKYTILPASKFVEVGTEPEPITQAQKDECVKLQERIKELEEKLSQTEHVSELRNRMIGEMAVKNTKSQERIEELEALCELRQQDIDNFADDLSDCNELINRMKELAKSSLSASNDMLNRAALRAIANGEI